MGEPAGGVREFYVGRSVFITGATGYLGKVTVEKLLRSCPEIAHIYMLVRPKRGKTSEERLRELLNSPVFDRLKKEQVSFASKIVLIHGNMEEEGLGIDPSDVYRLIQDTSVIIHNAATIRFTEPIKKAVKINISGLREMIILGKRMKKLEAFVHVSTAYSNCNRQVIDEKLYPQRLSPDQLISATNWLTDSELDIMLPWILKDYPNTYTFTKAVAELLLEEEKGEIPAAIIRPSIIVSSFSDPVPGWVDGLAGANGVQALQGLGILRKMRGDMNNIGDLIPVDMMANSSIVAGWKLAKDRPKSVYIVNMTSGQLKPVTWGESFAYWAEHEYKYPCRNVVRPPTSKLFTTKPWLRNIHQILDHYMPAIMFDFLARITRQSPKYWKSVSSFGKFTDVVEYFACREWIFENTNTSAMYQSLSTDEKKTFNFDVRCVDWRQFGRHWWLGTRQFVWKEDLGKQPEYDTRFSRILLRRRLVWMSFGLVALTTLARAMYGSEAYTEGVLPAWSRLVTRIRELLRWNEGDLYVISPRPRSIIPGMISS